VRVNNVETYRESCAARGGCHGPDWTAKLKQFGAWMVATFKLLRIHSEVACLLVFADASRGRNSSRVTGTPSVLAFAYLVGKHSLVAFLALFGRRHWL
jgi:hypothetical protein